MEVLQFALPADSCLGGSIALLELGGGLLLEHMLLPLMYFMWLELRSNVLLGCGVELAVLLLFLSSGASLMLSLRMIVQNTSIRSCVITTCTLH